MIARFEDFIGDAVFGHFGFDLLEVRWLVALNTNDGWPTFSIGFLRVLDVEYFVFRRETLDDEIFQRAWLLVEIDQHVVLESFFDTRQNLNVCHTSQIIIRTADNAHDILALYFFFVVVQLIVPKQSIKLNWKLYISLMLYACDCESTSWFDDN